MLSDLMIHIAQSAEGKKNVLRVEGWLQDEAVAELQRVAEAAGSDVALDLSELRMADKRGVETLRGLADRGIELRGVSPLIALLLDSKR